MDDQMRGDINSELICSQQQLRFPLLHFQTQLVTLDHNLYSHCVETVVWFRLRSRPCNHPNTQMFKLKTLYEHVRRAERKRTHRTAGASRWTLSRFQSGSFPTFLIKTLLKPEVSEERTGRSHCVGTDTDSSSEIEKGHKKQCGI